MTFMVPFDGSPLAEAALVRARQFAIALEEAPREIVRWLLPEETIDIVAVSVVPEGASYARRKGWIRENDEFSTRRVVESLHEEVTDLAPNANFRYVRVDGAATAGTIGSRLRREAQEVQATDVFIGSIDAGRIVTPITSVGSGIAAEQAYDVHIVRKPLPPRLKRRFKSEFFIPE